MCKADQDLISVRVAFELFERQLATNTEKSVAKHGLTKTLQVAAMVAKIRKELHDLHLMMYPPVDQAADRPMSDEEYRSYIG
jgi:hypothetical protein